eukprot:5111019-Karenia_brevis.AAC.2
MLKDESIFNIATSGSLMEQSWNATQGSQGESKDSQLTKAVSTLTYAQRKKMQSKEKPQNGSVILKSKTLDLAFAENMRNGKANQSVSEEKKRKANEAWMQKLRQGDYS